LDLGCGPGYLLQGLADLGYRVYGLDSSPLMVEEARRRLAVRRVGPRQAVIESGDVTCWQPPRRFDGVAALGLLEYLPNDEGLLRVANRVLSLGGRFIVECRNLLFNLVSLNQYTRDVLQAGEYEELLREYEELLRCSKLRRLDEVTDQLVSALAKTFHPETAPETIVREDPVIEQERSRRFAALVRRQHSPLKLSLAAGRFGFELTYLRFLHLHPFPPQFEQQAPRVFRQLGMALEVLGDTPLAAVMGSSFLAGFEKRSDGEGT
jgi:SAM-dependent methyltransferase